MSSALQKLREFVEYVEKKAKEAPYGLDPQEVTLIWLNFEQLKALAENDMNDINISDLISLEAKFNTILAEAQSRFKIHKKQVECRWLKYLCALLIGGGLLGLVIKLLG
ncbi:hypothetical protein [Thermococcus gorgonarius]|uniref:Uncharacterized protein n=1 Tax=Thermococcus gorgonarius TaxID=71997 RepID=A0A2Z2MGS0_THEGO|nr:hypothetical protein [Thermococcus gorgonarius]ASJ01168.1 hypothetical protein A3K92_06565 [Thermococcus gorgonarius]